LSLFGTEVVIQGMIGETKTEITGRAVACGSTVLPDDLYVSAASGMLKYLQSVRKEGRIKSPEDLQRVLEERHQRPAIMAKDPHNPRPSICWKPALTVIKRI